jgi:hypothetical protein
LVQNSGEKKVTQTEFGEVGLLDMQEMNGSLSNYLSAKSEIEQIKEN